MIICSLLMFIFSCRNLNDGNVIQRSDTVKSSELKMKADSIYNNDNYELAIIYYTLLLQKDSVNADAFFKRAYSFAQVFRYEESTSDYLKAIKLNYRKSDAYFNLGCNFSAQMNFERALYYFQKALELEPNNQAIKDLIKISKGNLKISQI